MGLGPMRHSLNYLCVRDSQTLTKYWSGDCDLVFWVNTARTVESRGHFSLPLTLALQLVKKYLASDTEWDQNDHSES